MLKISKQFKGQNSYARMYFCQNIPHYRQITSEKTNKNARKTFCFRQKHSFLNIFYFST